MSQATILVAENRVVSQPVGLLQRLKVILHIGTDMVLKKPQVSNDFGRARNIQL